VTPLSPTPKAGDKLAVTVAVWGSSPRLIGIFPVHHVTRTGQIVVGNMRFDASGDGMGPMGRDKHLRWPTDADRAEVADRALRDRLIWRLEHATLTDKTTEELAAAVKALGFEVAP
jgi:hypothetical protein